MVREEIGVGATSIVYEAEHRTLRHLVAVKVLRSAHEMDGELRLRFEREMKLCTSISSLHVPHVYEVGELPSGLPYIVMERLSGSTLAEWLVAHRTLPVPVVVEIGAQLCAALASLHERQVLHRDVKPENIVLHRAFADGYVLKLVDFGICKSLVSDGLSLTRQGTVVGTPEYMSPEQVQGIGVDARTDVYSTGVVLYELLTGRAPFQGRDLDLLGRAILFATPPRPTALRPDLSPALEAIVLRAMARDRADRHSSIHALERELDRFADAQALRRHPAVWRLLPASGTRRAAPPPAPVRRATISTLSLPRIPIRRGAIATAVVATVGVLLTAALSVAYYVYDPFERAPPVRIRPPSPRPAGGRGPRPEVAGSSASAPSARRADAGAERAGRPRGSGRSRPRRSRSRRTSRRRSSRRRSSARPAGARAARCPATTGRPAGAPRVGRIGCGRPPRARPPRSSSPTEPSSLHPPAPRRSPPPARAGAGCRPCPLALWPSGSVLDEDLRIVKPVLSAPGARALVGAPTAALRGADA
ncbi:MAG: serine/threonine protein kinase, partial [Sandaracinaceae bacterium]|nr:serine/threonine protein kinase [Sandaracinaceae bacterium]